MGIPHLITHLQPYASSEPLQGRDMVIDGPGLAHHVYYICLGRRSSARHCLEAAPSYKELGEVTIEWLQVLREHGKKIYFDGYLPRAKYGVRIGRLANSTKRVENYWATYSHTIPYRMQSTVPEAGPLLTSRTVRSKLSQIPPAPFLVPAIIEELGKSEQYKHLAEVVPGEADGYCARYVSRYGGTILTSDSDLLVYDLGQDGFVSLFKDMNISVGQNSGILYSNIYHPSSIVGRLALPESHGLRTLAFEIFLDPHADFRRLLLQATNLKAVKAHSEQYTSWEKEYVDLSDGKDSDSTGGFLELTAVFRNLDPRISEYVLQFPCLARIAGQEEDAAKKETDGVHVFLPFLFDYPRQTSAWEISTSMRQLAYGLMNIIVPEDEKYSSVFEHRRQQGNSSGREWQIPQLAEIPEACTALVSFLDEFCSKFAKLPNNVFWTVVAVYQRVDWMNLKDKSIVGHDLPENVAGNACTWDVIHFLAQIQGSYYSFRMLKQILHVLVAYTKGENLPESVIQLFMRLKSLPSLHDVPDIHQASLIIHTIQSCEALGVIHKMLGIPEPTTLEPLKRKKKKNKEPKTKSSIPQNRSANRFEVLKIK
ncbi:hypothetical protein B7494_g5328 [Chlorociboria aeruginascens]|nr:hypothetical protein B7494_g5328 [Chlorociboria aeruginascens]